MIRHDIQTECHFRDSPGTRGKHPVFDPGDHRGAVGATKRRLLETIHDPSLEVQTWMDMDPDLVSAITLQETMMFVIFINDACSPPPPSAVEKNRARFNQSLLLIINYRGGQAPRGLTRSFSWSRRRRRKLLRMSPRQNLRPHIP